MEVFRRLLLERLHKAERLSETFMLNLLSWVHPGFSLILRTSLSLCFVRTNPNPADYAT